MYAYVLRADHLVMNYQLLCCPLEKAVSPLSALLATAESSWPLPASALVCPCCPCCPCSAHAEAVMSLRLQMLKAQEPRSLSQLLVLWSLQPFCLLFHDDPLTFLSVGFQPVVNLSLFSLYAQGFFPI
ncbi:hypothetical protein U0070_000108 [Myodes glareolus]|uniref:Uncharacterized protein n=1 Tax=Myodes glareolus TaxID=447135 RepID=A0AAW0I0X3_MYOGA